MVPSCTPTSRTHCWPATNKKDVIPTSLLSVLSLTTSTLVPNPIITDSYYLTLNGPAPITYANVIKGTVTHSWGGAQMSIQMSANVDVECRQGSLEMSMEVSKIYRFITRKKPKETRIICWKNAESYVDVYIHTHTYTHTHTHTHFSSIFTRRSAKN